MYALQSALPACPQLSLQLGNTAQEQRGLRLQVGWSVEGLDRMRRQGAQHLPPLFGVLVAQYKAAGSAILHQVCAASWAVPPSPVHHDGHPVQGCRGSHRAPAQALHVFGQHLTLAPCPHLLQQGSAPGGNLACPAQSAS